MIASFWTPRARAACGLALVAGLCGSARPAAAAATIVIVNGNAAGVGFNDPTPAAPVGGNAGITLGQQRLNVFQAAASIWGAQLTSSSVIRVLATMEPLACTATTAVLGSAGAQEAFAQFTGAVPDTWYAGALSNKIYGSVLTSVEEIRARFNSNLGLNANCLPGSPFYLGLDNNHGTGLDLLTVLLHEIGHGLGFQTFTSGSTGRFLADLYPSIWDYFLRDAATGLTWNAMTNAQRATSALNFRNLAWTGVNVSASAPSVLSFGYPSLRVAGPASVARSYDVGAASFGPQLSSPGATGVPVVALDASNASGPSNSDGCTALTNGAAVAGKIAIIDRGTCSFKTKTLNAQNAGAIGVVIADNAAGSPAGLGDDPTITTPITIPTARISQADGVSLKAALNNPQGSRTRPSILFTLGADASRLAGADAANRPLMYTPNPLIGGSSVSHWDTVAFRNQLMEPNINGDLTHSVLPPEDLTFKLLQDIGW